MTEITVPPSGITEVRPEVPKPRPTFNLILEPTGLCSPEHGELWQIADDDGGIGAPIESDSPYHHIVTIPSEEESAMLGKREEAIRNIVGYARELTCLSIVSTSPAVVTTIMTKLGDAINDLDALDAERRKAKEAGNGE